MLSQQNNIVKQQIMKQIRQFQSKQKMIEMYIQYQYPQTQRRLKNWWQQLIENIIRKKNQIYINFKDLQWITTIYNVKPHPLKQILKQLKKEVIMLKQSDIFPQKPVQKPAKSWYNNIYDWVWSKKKQQQLNPFTFAPDEKIISFKTKQRKKKQLRNILHDQFQLEHVKTLIPLIRHLTFKLKLDQASIIILLRQLKKQKELYFTEESQEGRNFIIYHYDRKLMQDENFLKIQKIKFLLKLTKDKFQAQYQKSSARISNYKLKAKQALHNQDKNKAKVYIVQVKKQQQRRSNINLRMQVIDQKLSQIQINQMNKSSIDLLQDATKIYQQIAIDPDKFDQVMAQSRQAQLESEEGNRRFAEMAASQEIEDQVDDMMKELQGQISQKRKIVQPQSIKVNINENRFEKQKQKPDEDIII